VQDLVVWFWTIGFALEQRQLVVAAYAAAGPAAEQLAAEGLAAEKPAVGASVNGVSVVAASAAGAEVLGSRAGIEENAAVLEAEQFEHVME
jgi:hypothetical protein